MFKQDSIFSAVVSVLGESSKELEESKGDAYDLMKDVEKQLKDLAGDFRNFHDGHEEDALDEIHGALLYCVDLIGKIKKKL